MAATGAIGDQMRGGDLFFACIAAPQVDKTRAASVCAEFLEVLKRDPAFNVLDSQGTELDAGPGLEVLVNRATDSQLELIPTWVDSAGRRMVLPSSGISAMDIDLSKEMRRRLYLSVLAGSPK